MSIVGDARTMLKDGRTAAETRAALIQAYGKPAAYQAMQHVRAEGLLPPRAEKLARVEMRLSPAVRERLRRVSEDREMLPARIAHQAFLAGLAAMEGRL